MSRRARTAAPYVIAGLVLVVLSALTLMQARVYAGPLLLWDDAIRKNPTSPMLRYNYGSRSAGGDRAVAAEEVAKGFVEEAMRQFEEAVKLDPKHDRAWTRWGGTLIFLRQAGGGAGEVRRGARAAPGQRRRAGRTRAGAVRAEAIRRGAGGVQRRRWRRRRRSAAPARSRASSWRAIYQYLGRIAVEKNDLETAAKHYAEAVKIARNDALMHYEYGTVLARQAKLAESAAAATQAATQATTRAATQAATPATTPATTQASATEPSERIEAASRAGGGAIRAGGRPPAPVRRRAHRAGRADDGRRQPARRADAADGGGHRQREQPQSAARSGRQTLGRRDAQARSRRHAAGDDAAARQRRRRRFNSLSPVLRGEGRGEGLGARGGQLRPICRSATDASPSVSRRGTLLAPLPSPLPGVPGRGSKI